MIYDKNKIKKIVEFKDTIENIRYKKYIEWLLSFYNEYYIHSREFDEQRKKYKDITIKYYDAEEDKYNLMEKYNTLNRKYNTITRRIKEKNIKLFDD